MSHRDAPGVCDAAVTVSLKTCVRCDRRRRWYGRKRMFSKFIHRPREARRSSVTDADGGVTFTVIFATPLIDARSDQGLSVCHEPLQPKIWSSHHSHHPISTAPRSGDARCATERVNRCRISKFSEVCVPVVSLAGAGGEARRRRAVRRGGASGSCS